MRAWAVIPYRNRGVPARYIPDFIAVTDKGVNVIVEIKGQVTDSADVKSKAATRWVAAVNRTGQFGQWHYLLVTDPGTMSERINPFVKEQWNEGLFLLTP